MSKMFAAGAAILFATAGFAAFAQDLPATATSQTTTTTTAVNPYVNDRTRNVTEHTVQADGTEITKSRTYSSGDGQLSGTTRVQVTTPEGINRTVETRENTVSGPPVPLTSMTRETTTTTVTH